VEYFNKKMQQPRIVKETIYPGDKLLRIKDMNRHLLQLTRIFWVITLLGLAVGCQDTIPQRSTISPGSSAGNLVCDEDQEIVKKTVDGVETYVCQDLVLKRPDNAVFWKTNFCACKDRKPVSYGNCSTFCAEKAATVETLYASFTVSDAISLSTDLGSVYAWCKTNLPGDTVNPECELQAKDEAGNIMSMEVAIAQGSNSLTANIGDKLAYDKTYVLTLVEKSTGVKSNSIQLIKFSSDTTLPTLGTLRVAPVTQYTCMKRISVVDQSSGDIYYEGAYRLHFYFVPRLPPAAIPPGNQSEYVCHDIFSQMYGLVDNILYPRFEQIPNSFNLWDTTDPRFYDNDGNGNMDINDAIVLKTRNFGGSISASSKFFISFQWTSLVFEDQTNAGNTNTSQALGHYMAPWIDQTTFKSYCPTSTHYNGTNPLFKALRDYIGVDTEGLYVGVKPSETFTTTTGDKVVGDEDYLLIRESDLKSVWFYLKSNVPTAPNDDNVTNNAVFFYYPLNKTSPYVQSSTQKLYQVKSAAELSAVSGTSSGSTSGGTSTSYPPHDRKIGCIPKP
jgi:hypothetical protein